MNRTPPNLLYLSIYNPTLQPTVIVDGDNEDAEEQAHILFYTSKERAVSRDRMLRQIGLAKALVNFAEYVSDTPPLLLELYELCRLTADGWQIVQHK